MSQTRRDQIREFEQDIDDHIAGKFDCPAAVLNMVDNPPRGDGGATNYYKLPVGATELRQLIHHKKMVNILET